MLYIYTWKDKPRKEKVVDVVKMAIFVIVATTAIALIHGAVNHAADSVTEKAS